MHRILNSLAFSFTSLMIAFAFVIDCATNYGSATSLKR